MAAGSIAKAEYERLVARTMNERFLGRAFSGLREEMSIWDRVRFACRHRREQALAVETLSGTEEVVAEMAIGRALRKLAAMGATPRQLAVTLHCPLEMTEAELRPWLRTLCKAEIPYSDVKIVREVLSMTAITAVAGGSPRNPRGDEEEYGDATASIVLCGYAGGEGTELLYLRNEENLRARYAEHFLAGIHGLCGRHTDTEGIRIAVENGAALLVACGDGGVFGGLWELGETVRCGMRIDLPLIPISQQTIEVCEVLDRNPYLLASGNCVLAVTAEPERLLSALWANGYEAARIGELNLLPSRELHNRGEVRYIEPFRGGMSEL